MWDAQQLQSKAGYIDARPLTTSSTKLLRRTAGPYIRVKLDQIATAAQCRLILRVRSIAAPPRTVVTGQQPIWHDPAHSRFLTHGIGDANADGGENAEPDQPTLILFSESQELLPPQRHKSRHHDEMQRAAD